MIYKIIKARLPCNINTKLNLISVSYWAAGGLGTCKPCDNGICDTQECLDKGGCVEKTIDGVANICYTYIYPITDWGNHPGLACITVAVGVIALPICHLIWLGVFKLRMLIYENTCGRKIEQVKLYTIKMNRKPNLGTFS